MQINVDYTWLKRATRYTKHCDLCQEFEKFQLSFSVFSNFRCSASWCKYRKDCKVSHWQHYLTHTLSQITENHMKVTEQWVMHTSWLMSISPIAIGSCFSIIYYVIVVHYIYLIVNVCLFFRPFSHQLGSYIMCYIFMTCQTSILFGTTTVSCIRWYSCYYTSSKCQIKLHL